MSAQINELQSAIDTFQIEEITENRKKLDLAFQLIAQAYSGLASRAIDQLEIYRSLCNDTYHQTGLARTLLLTGYNPNADQIVPLGTCRFVLGMPWKHSSNHLPFEAMQLFTHNPGWQTFTFAQFDPNNAVELGRLAILPECRIGKAKTLKLHHMIVVYLIREACIWAEQQYNRTQAWAILPIYMVKVLERAGIVIRCVPNVYLNHKEQAALFTKYDRYWLDGKPKFYKVEIDS